MKIKQTNETNKIDTNECECAIVELDKKMVDYLISRNTKNRKIVKSNIKKLQDEFSNGRYCFTGQPIIVDQEDNLLDGQHRLYALRNANYPKVRVLFVRLKGDSGVIAKAYDKMDTGVTRRFGVKLQAMGVKNSLKVAAICTKISYVATGYAKYPVHPDSYLMDILNLYCTNVTGDGACEENNYVHRMASLMKSGNGFLGDMAAGCCVVARVTGCYDEVEGVIKRALDGSMLVRGSAEHTLNKLFSGTIKRDQKGRGYNSSCFAVVVNALIAHLNNQSYPIADRNVKKALKWIEMMAKDNGVFILPKTIRSTGIYKVAS